MKVTLYTAEGCGLCREAEHLLLRLAERIRFELEIVNIEANAALYDRYWARVPVVLVDGREVAAAPIDERRVAAALRR